MNDPIQEEANPETPNVEQIIQSEDDDQVIDDILGNLDESIEEPHVSPTPIV